MLTGSVGFGALLGARSILGPTDAVRWEVTGRSAPREKARRGGTLRAGLSGGTSSDTVDPLNPLNETDFARVYQLYDSLVAMDRNAGPVLALAEEITPNSDATAWTIRLRAGVEFHNGKPLTADDVIYTFQQILDPKAPAAGASAISFVDAKAMKRLDALTLRVPCTRPFATFYETMPLYYYSIIPVGFNSRRPVGTGPFKFESFTPGVQSTFVRNDNNRQRGLPYVDSVVISDYPDETSQINALVAGQADVVNLLSAPAIAGIRSGGAEVVISDGGGWTPFTMRVDQAPFNDVRVRQAFRLMVNRRQMMEVVFGGYGTLGNDVFGIFDPEYDHALPQREQDIAQARYLLKKAGHENLSTQIVTGDIAQGVVQAAEVFAQQVSAAGVKVALDKVTSTAFFGPNYLKWRFAQDFWGYYGYLPQVGFATLPASPYNETHWGNPHYINLYNQALATVDSSKRSEIAHEMQRIDYDAGGYIIPYFPPLIDGHAKKVQGLAPAKVGRPLFNYDFKSLWLS
ncbi:MAG: ABC transporter substrate-binding protein [Acidimicrobiales bacterium]